MTIRIAVLACALLVAGMTQPWRLLAQGQAPEPAKGIKYAQISPTDMQEWLTYLSSDTLLGRQVFTEGYGLAAGYISSLVKQWGLKPMGDNGSYLQMVKLKGYQVTRNSSVTVDVNGQSRTFKHGDHVTFATAAGGKQTLNFTGVEFVGYGQPTDYQGKDVKGKLVAWVPNMAPQAGGGGRGGRGGRGGGAAAVSTMGASAAIGFAPATPAPTPAEEALARAQSALTQATDAVNQAQQAVLAAQRGAGAFGGGFGGGGGRGRGAATVPADITTVTRVDGIIPPQFTADDTFFDFLLTGWPTKFADIRAKAEKGEPIAPFSLPGVKVTVNIDNRYDVVNEQITHNVVAMVEGTDPKLKDTYVFIGAHLDHIGYSQTGGGNQPAPTACRARGPLAIDALTKAGKTPQNAGRRGGGQQAAAGAAAAPAGRAGGTGAAAPAPAAGAAVGQAQAAAGAGRGAGGRGAVSTVPFDQRDFISNGADDDGSGSTGALAIAKAFATGPKPRRSIIFVWHTGEEAGLYGSRYNADFPVVPLEKVQAQLNMDMIGRDDCNDVEGDYSNSVFIVGADRISTDLHNLIVETNQTLPKPLGLDYELNDAADPESVYTRSDHYSYASKGIPIAFFTTGLHPDYHRVSDTVDKILFPKMARIAQLVYETGFSIANTDKVLTRDNKGPRTGFDTKPAIIKQP